MWRFRVIWHYQLGWRLKLATVKSFKADASSVYPSNKEIWRLSWLFTRTNSAVAELYFGQWLENKKRLPGQCRLLQSLDCTFSPKQNSSPFGWIQTRFLNWIPDPHVRVQSFQLLQLVQFPLANHVTERKHINICVRNRLIIMEIEDAYRITCQSMRTTFIKHQILRAS